MNTLFISIACVLSANAANESDKPVLDQPLPPVKHQFDELKNEPNLTLMHGYERFLDDPRSVQLDRIA